MSIKIVTDSTTYIPMDLRKKFDIQVVSLSINFDTETFLEEEIDNITFYKKMDEAKNIPSSSQPSVQNFCEVFENLLVANHKIVGVFISSEMSGTYNTAIMAKNKVLEKFPQGTIKIIDSRSNCMEAGFVALAAAQAAEEGLDLTGVLNAAYRVLDRTRFLFTPHNLDYLKKGGRIGGAAALLGTILQIKPILTVVDGKTAVFDKVRTKSRAIERILDVLSQDAQTKGLEKVVVHHINNPAEGEALSQQIKKKLNIEAPVYPIGPVIGVHVGPGTIGVVYQTKEPI
ncbi:MAG: DegV family protein [Tissierellia bacterium]|nr:DegV family protein [Tissierellia bacterium]